MKLVIAEKKSVGESIAAVVKATERKDGYYQGNGYIVSWCIGHLLGLATPQAYDAKYGSWRYEDLPIVPSQWKYAVTDEDKRPRLKILSELMKRTDVDTIICATDAGREGELIFRLVYNHCKCNKPIKRLWISSMEESAVTEGMNNLHNGKDYDNLYMAAECRAKADWIIGMNATRLFSVLYDCTLNIGRVKTPTLAMLVERSQAIENFVKTPFHIPELDCGSFILSGEKHNDKTAAESICAACDGKTAIITSVERKEKREMPPKLFDLTTLQREANRNHGYTAKQTLDHLQNLYEKKLATYPRTDSRYLTSDMTDSVKTLVSRIDGNAPCNTAQVINDSKVTDHHAIIPTLTALDTDVSALHTVERTILQMLMKRLIEAVGECHIYAETAVTAVCEGYIFKANGKSVVTAGWRTETDYKTLPSLDEGRSFSFTAKIREGFTSPPKHFTEDTLLAAMETAGKEDMPEDAERRGIGTPATRAEIIESLVTSKSGYVERKGKELRATSAAYALVSVVPDFLTSPLLTAEWEHKLKQVERGEFEQESFMDSIRDMTMKMVRTYNAPDTEKLKQFPARASHAPSGDSSLGKCPRCGGDVYENKKLKMFSCNNRACKFALWQDNKYFTSVLKKPLDTDTVKKLLKDGKVKASGLVSKGGKPYDATIVMSDDGHRISFSMVFDNSK